MTDPDRTYLLLFALIAVVLAVTALAGGLVWPNSSPANEPVGALSHIVSTRWHVEGCDSGTYAGSGANVAARGSVTLSAVLGNASVARQCVFVSVGGAPTGFSIINGSMTIFLPYDELTVLYVGVLVPATYWSGTLNLTVLATDAD